MTSIRRFGRARLSARKRAAETMYDLLYAGGWPALLARPLGLAGRLELENDALVVPGPADLSPLRVGFISDLHAGPATHPRLIADACAAVAEAKPDLLLLGGDFVAFHARFARRLVAPLAAIEAPLGKFAVLGNHDVIGDERFIIDRLADAGVRTLINESARLPAPYDRVWVCGLDNPEEGEPDGAAAFSGADGVRLVLMHSPDGLRAVEDRRFAIAFCGHTHGGQFILKSGRSLVNFHGPLSRKYLLGGRHVLDGDGRVLLVSRGIGQGSLPMRRRADPQVHVHTLRFASMEGGERGEWMRREGA
jgi:predicted MPP superfamily phosphohydrolase